MKNLFNNVGASKVKFSEQERATTIFVIKKDSVLKSFHPIARVPSSYEISGNCKQYSRI